MENSMKNNDEIEIDLRQIFIVILSKIAIILLVGVIFGLAAFIGSKLLLKPVYRSQTSLYVLNKQSQGTTTLSDLQRSLTAMQSISGQMNFMSDIPFYCTIFGKAKFGHGYICCKIRRNN